MNKTDKNGLPAEKNDSVAKPSFVKPHPESDLSEIGDYSKQLIS